MIEGLRWSSDLVNYLVQAGEALEMVNPEKERKNKRMTEEVVDMRERMLEIWKFFWTPEGGVSTETENEETK